MKSLTQVLGLIVLFSTPLVSFAEIGKGDTVLKPGWFGGGTICLVLSVAGEKAYIARSLGDGYYDSSSAKWVDSCKLKPISENSPAVITTKLAQVEEKHAPVASRASVTEAPATAMSAE